MGACHPCASVRKRPRECSQALGPPGLGARALVRARLVFGNAAECIAASYAIALLSRPVGRRRARREGGGSKEGHCCQQQEERVVRRCLALRGACRDKGRLELLRHMLDPVL